MKQTDWIEPITKFIGDGHGRGGFVIVFPEYRPDQFVALASTLGLRSFDYRAEVMSRFGWDADRLSLQDLDSTLIDLAAAGGAVVNNIEALLSTKNPHECTDWINRFLDSDWHHTLLVPVVINAALLPPGHPHVYRIPDKVLGEQSFLNRLTF